MVEKTAFRVTGWGRRRLENDREAGLSRFTLYYPCQPIEGKGTFEIALLAADALHNELDAQN